MNFEHKFCEAPVKGPAKLGPYSYHVTRRKFLSWGGFTKMLLGPDVWECSMFMFISILHREGIFTAFKGRQYCGSCDGAEESMVTTTTAQPPCRFVLGWACRRHCPFWFTGTPILINHFAKLRVFCRGISTAFVRKICLLLLAEPLNLELSGCIARIILGDSALGYEGEPSPVRLNLSVPGAQDLCCTKGTDCSCVSSIL